MCKSLYTNTYAFTLIDLHSYMQMNLLGNFLTFRQTNAELTYFAYLKHYVE